MPQVASFVESKVVSFSNEERIYLCDSSIEADTILNSLEWEDMWPAEEVEIIESLPALTDVKPMLRYTREQKASLWTSKAETRRNLQKLEEGEKFLLPPKPVERKLRRSARIIAKNSRNDGPKDGSGILKKEGKYSLGSIYINLDELEITETLAVRLSLRRSSRLSRR